MGTITFKIHNIGHNGEGIGSYEGFTFFVEGALPGEMVEAEIIKQHKNYGRARLKKILQSSPQRVEPSCRFFGQCGGCQIMHLSYDQQLGVKRQRVIDALRRIGKITDVDVAPCLPSPLSLNYRNKIQLPVRTGTIGLYARGTHDIVDVDSCQIHCALGEEVYKKIRVLAKETEGLRHILIKTAVNSEEVLVILVTSSGRLLNDLAKEIMSHCSHVKGVVQNINDSVGNTILGKTYKVLAGAGHITEKLCGLIFKVSPASFFQVNPQQAECLYAKALEFAELSGEETVLDAYCGVGTLSLIFARQAERVIGVECIPEAIEDAKGNAQLNQVGNVSFVCADAESYIQKLTAIDLVLLNPPRKGCDPAFLEGVKRLHPKKVVYISCDPATLARDLSQLCSYGYKIEAVQPYDMFPQTAHVECVVSLV